MCIIKNSFTVKIIINSAAGPNSLLYIKLLLHLNYLNFTITYAHQVEVFLQMNCEILLKCLVPISAKIFT